MKTLHYLACSLLLPISLTSCATSPADDTGNDVIDDGKGDGATAKGTYFECTGLGTNDTVWLGVEKTKVVVTVEDVGVNTGDLTTTDDTSKTFSSWDSKVFFGTGDTLVIPDSLLSSGSGKVEWNMANVNPHWEGTCKKKKPTGDQCLPIVENIDPIDSNATPSYDTVSNDHYTVTIPDSKVGDFVYKIGMHTSGILCTQGAITATSCSAIVADKIEAMALADGSSSGGPYVESRTESANGYTWSGGVHDAESGDFAYTVTTDGEADGCSITGVTTVTN